jgi:hypothetical protein
MKLQEAIGVKQTETPGSVAYGVPPPPSLSYHGNEANQGHPTSARQDNEVYL